MCTVSTLSGKLHHGPRKITIGGDAASIRINQHVYRALVVSAVITPANVW